MSLSLTLDGSTRLYVILGDPIAQVKSPGGITAEMVARGANAVLVPLHVLPADLDEVMAALKKLRNLEGVILTVPHKIAVLKHVASLTDRARFVGASNILRRITPGGDWHGDMTDGMGLVGAIRARGCEPKGRRALLVGAGGAGSAIAFALVEAGVSELAIHDADTARRDGLITRLAATGAKVRAGSPDPSGFDLAVNATPMGMKPTDPLPIDASKLNPSAFAADVITAPEQSPYLEAAAARGCGTSPGTAMFAAQAGFIAEFMLAAPKGA